MSLHPLIARVQPTRRARLLSSDEVMRLSPRDLVRYCDRLLTELPVDEATEFAIGCLQIDDAPRVVHGTYGAYATHGCRCESCRAANAAYGREYRLRHRAS